MWLSFLWNMMRVRRRWKRREKRRWKLEMNENLRKRVSRHLTMYTVLYIQHTIILLTHLPFSCWPSVKKLQQHNFLTQDNFI